MVSIASYATGGVDPSYYGDRPNLTIKALEGQYYSRDLDLIEANEAFASQASCNHKPRIAS